ncbi:MAG TPA: YncE family protein [Mycobacterium sp.]|nr:YncE family protein [Mycobacterium sp.]
MSSSRAAAILGAVLVAAVACGEPPSAGPTTTTTGLPPAAEPEAAPEQNQPIPGRTVAVGEAPEGVVVDSVTRTVAVAARNPNELVLLNADTGEITGRTPLPGFARHLQLAKLGGPVLVPVESANVLVRVELPGGRAQPPIATGRGPHDATQAANGTVFVTNEFGGRVAALRGDAVVKDFGGSVQPGGIAASGDTVGCIDVRKNDLTIYDANALTVVGSVPAGQGPTHLIGDRHGRLVVTDTRGNMIRVLTPRPPQEVASVEQAGGPYGIAYDPTRDRLWVTSTGTNEVVGYDMAGATPREVQRLATVQNPNTVGVDDATGRLFIAGVPGGVVQIVDPPS